MDLFEAIRQLQVEKKRLDRVIASLEELHAESLGGKLPSIKTRRGRKGMSRKERLEVSQRMKAYWASRRAPQSEKESDRSPARRKKPLVD